MIRSFFRLPRTVIVVGAGPAVLGLIEGVADATASLLKLVAGMAADRTGRWRRFVRTGYAVSNAARPLIGLAGSWGGVLRVAWISDLAPTGLRATLFGAFHMATGLAVLPGAVLIGIIWEMYDAPAAFLVSAVLTAFFAFYLFRSAGRIGMGEPVPGRP